MAIARLSHEGNSFSPLVTGLAEFQRREWVTGAAASAFYAGTRCELGAAVDFLAARSDWDGHFLRCAAAVPGGPVESGVLRAIGDEILAGLATAPWQGVYISLHGALIGESELAADLDLVTAIRARIGDVPLAVSFDLHANLDPAMAGIADIIVGYKTYPHVDTYETGAKALDLLDGMANGRLAPVTRIVPLGAVLSSVNMRTESGPMQAVAAHARAAESASGLLDVTPFGGFAYADVPTAGASVSVCADGDAALAQRTAEDMADFFRARRPEFAVSLPDAETGIRRALDRTVSKPVAVLEPADNPMSGGIGDTVGLFQALLAAKPAVPTVFAFFWDPDLVARAVAAGIGGDLTCRLGGRLVPDYGAAVPVAARVQRLTDGRFINRGPMERGLPVDLGPTAVLEVAGIQVIVTSACQSPNDVAYFDLHGIDLGAVRLLCVKAKNHFRAAFRESCAEIIDVDTPGPASAELARLRFRRVAPDRLPPAGSLRNGA
ncbi:MAG TPA: M81 family metallopeptidase [Kiloniellales bacterium]